MSTHSDIERQEVLVGLLCKGIKNFTKTKCQTICKMVHQITEFDLDNTMLEHATQLNFVRAKRDTNGELIDCELDENGVLSIKVNLTERLWEAKNLFIIDELATCKTQAEIKEKLDHVDWNNLNVFVDSEQFLQKLDKRVELDDDIICMREIWSEHKYVKYLFSKSYSIKYANLCDKYWIFTKYSTDSLSSFSSGFFVALIERVIVFFPCVFFLDVGINYVSIFAL